MEPTLDIIMISAALVSVISTVLIAIWASYNKRLLKEIQAAQCRRSYPQLYTLALKLTNEEDRNKWITLIDQMEKDEGL